MRKLYLIRFLFVCWIFIISEQCLAEKIRFQIDSNQSAQDELRKYIGKKIEVSEGEVRSAFLISPKTVLLKKRTALLGGMIYSPSMLGERKDFLLLLEKSINDESQGMDDTLLDVVEVEPSFEMAGWEGEYDCIDELHQQENIFALGKWRVEVGKHGRGRVYMSPIVRAWRVDFVKKKLVEIPTNTVMCVSHNSTEAP